MNNIMLFVLQSRIPQRCPAHLRPAEHQVDRKGHPADSHARRSVSSAGSAELFRSSYGCPFSLLFFRAVTQHHGLPRQQEWEGLGLHSR